MASHPNSTPNRQRMSVKQLPSINNQFPRTPQIFPYFLQLPEEIQAHIWKLAAHEERRIRIHSIAGQLWSVPHRTSKIDGQPKTPPILQVCRKLRDEALRWHTLCQKIDLPRRHWSQLVCRTTNVAESGQFPNLICLCQLCCRLLCDINAMCSTHRRR